MKNISVFTVLVLSLSGFSQNKSLSYVPSSCSYIVDIDLKRITSNMSVEEAEGFQFIKTITENYLQLDPKTVSLKTIGIDYQGHAVYFAGGTENTSFTGTIVPIQDEKLFINKTITDNIIRQSLLKTGSFVENQTVYLVQDGFFIAATVSASEQLAFNAADSLFDAKGWEKPFRWDFFSEEGINWEEFEVTEESEEAIEEIFILEEDTFEEEITEEEYLVPPPPENMPEEEELVEELAEALEGLMDDSRYYEVKDSILAILSEEQANLFLSELKSNQRKLIDESTNFKQAMVKPSDVKLFVNSTSIYSKNEFPYSVNNNPFFNGLDAYLQNTWQAGYMNFTETGMTIDWFNHTGEKITNVISAMSKSKYDKKLLAYIPASTNGFMVLNMNTKAAYDEVKRLYMPMLDESDDPDMLLASAVWSLLDEIINEEALFDLYFSKAFVSYNGIRDMVVDKTTYDYDPETFEYEERVEKEIQKIPALTFGLSTSRTYLVTKFMNAMAAQGFGGVQKEVGYYKMKSGPIPGVAFYLMVKDDIIILTNEQDIVRNNPNGYGKNAISGATAKKAGSAKMMYANMNLENLPEELNDLITNPSDRKFLKALSENSGELEMELGEIKKDYYSFNATYTFHGKHKSGAHYFMEVLNLMMSYEDEYYDDF